MNIINDAFKSLRLSNLVTTYITAANQPHAHLRSKTNMTTTTQAQEQLQSISHNGKIHYVTPKGYGFIIPESQYDEAKPKCIFFHLATGCAKYYNVQQGDLVTFNNDVAPDKRRRAINVKPVDHEELLKSLVKGTVKWFNSSKKYGFIIQEDLSEIFFYRDACTPSNYTPAEFDTVEYRVQNREDGQPFAVGITNIESE